MSPTSNDPRDPISRIARLVDGGKFDFLIPRTDCGMIAVTATLRATRLLFSHPMPQLKAVHSVWMVPK